MPASIKIVIQENNRGGWEIAMPDTAPGGGVGNYSTSGDAYAVARYNYDPAEIKGYEKPKKGSLKFIRTTSAYSRLAAR